jgi:mRNA interferase HigB
MALIAFQNKEAIIVWAGSHDEYDATFKGNKNTIEKWLRIQQLI